MISGATWRESLSSLILAGDVMQTVDCVTPIKSSFGRAFYVPGPVTKSKSRKCSSSTRHDLPQVAGLLVVGLVGSITQSLHLPAHFSVGEPLPISQPPHSAPGFQGQAPHLHGPEGCRTGMKPTMSYFQMTASFAEGNQVVRIQFPSRVSVKGNDMVNLNALQRPAGSTSGVFGPESLAQSRPFRGSFSCTMNLLHLRNGIIRGRLDSIPEKFTTLQRRNYKDDQHAGKSDVSFPHGATHPSFRRSVTRSGPWVCLSSISPWIASKTAVNWLS